MRAHIVSHSHLDREWYESFEGHRMKVVELIDDLIYLFENDEDFKSFHLDGQVILLDDYLEIKPQNKEIIKRLIKEKKLIVGPYYILQDELLLSGEENVRNSLVGKSYEKEWGKLCQVGYFPDTFGHVGKIAELCAKSGLKYAFFGRGVKAIGFDNEVLDDENFSSNYSEMYLESADGSRVLGILFANWYCNGNEIPVDKEEAKEYWDKRIEGAKRFASTDSLLFMNGCDHQPVQKNLSEAIRVANELYPDIEFIHSNLEDYAREVEKKLPSDLAVIKGEMTSQETDGFYTLANTASSRIYLKQANARISDKLFMTLEPFLMMSGESKKYKGQLDYATKLLLQNLPHDSICGCSIDEVHREMEVRFEKAEKVIEYIIEELFGKYGGSAFEGVILPDGAIPFLSFNPAPNPKVEIINGVYDLKKHYFGEDGLSPQELYQKLLSKEHKKYKLYNLKGEIVSEEVFFKEVRFGYDLPKDSFRKGYVAEAYEIEFLEEIDATSFDLYYLLESEDRVVFEDKEAFYFGQNYSLELDEESGCIEYRSAVNDYIVKDLIKFVDTGDIGNEYIYKAPRLDGDFAGDEDRKAIELKFKEVVDVEKTPTRERWILKYSAMIPLSADERLLEEEKALVEFRDRKAGRSKEKSEFELILTLNLYAHSSAIRCHVEFDNKQKNHRLTMELQTGFKNTKTHFADSSFEIVTRNNEASKEWKNETNPQHLLKLVGASEDDFGFLLSSSGINEYEAKSSEDGLVLALTLLRSVDELGDWGYFKTQDSLCLGKSSFDIVIDTFRHNNRDEKIKRALMNGHSCLSCTCDLDKEYSKLNLAKLPQNNKVFYTALKRAENGENDLARYLNLSSEDINFSINKEPKFVNLLEERIDDNKILGAFSVKTEEL